MFGISLLNLLPRKLSTYLIIAIAVLAIIVYLLFQRCGRLEQERDRQKFNTNALMSEVKRMQIDSSTMALDVSTLKLTLGEYKQYRAEDLAKIKQMGIRIKDLEAVAKHELVVNAPIKADIRDSVVIRDTIPVIIKSVDMNTPYIRLHGTIENNRLEGNIYLPVTLRQAVWVEYQRRWIFWKKLKAVHQTISSDNPYVEIIYSEYITIKK